MLSFQREKNKRLVSKHALGIVKREHDVQRYQSRMQV